MAATTTTLLGTAGIAPDQWASEVALDYPNKAVMMPLVRRYSIGLGESLYIPKVGERTVTARARGTEDTDALTYKALDDEAATFTKRFAWDALEVGYTTLNDLPPERLRMWLEAEKSQMGWALANDVDSKLLGLYSSAASNVGDGSGDITFDMIVESIKTLRVANAPGPYFMVLPETQWDHLAKIDELTRYDIRGEQGAIDRQAFRVHGMDIFTTGNCPAAANITHGLAFAGEGIAFAARDMIGVKEWDEPNNLAFRLAAWADYIYANTYSDYIVDVRVKEG